MVSDEDIRGEVETHDHADSTDPAPLTWTRPVCRYQYLYETTDAKKARTTQKY